MCERKSSCAEAGGGGGGGAEDDDDDDEADVDDGGDDDDEVDAVGAEDSRGPARAPPSAMTASAAADVDVDAAVVCETLDCGGGLFDWCDAAGGCCCGGCC